MDGGYVYPGSGSTCDSRLVEQQEPAADAGAPIAEGAQAEAGAESNTHGELYPEDPDLEFATAPGDQPPPSGPRIINVGIPGPGNAGSQGPSTSVQICGSFPEAAVTLLNHFTYTIREPDLTRTKDL